MSGPYVARSANVAARKIGDELMIMSGRDSSLFSLNETAAVLWQAADGSTTLDDIARRLCEQFDVDHATALSDARETADALAGHGILVVSDSPIEGAAPAVGDRR